jgi:hypothetical protein
MHDLKNKIAVQMVKKRRSKRLIFIVGFLRLA